jgi:hypothetical protein
MWQRKFNMTKPIQDNDAEFTMFLKHEGQLAIEIQALAEDPPDALTASILQRAEAKLDAEKMAAQSACDEAARCELLKAQQATIAAANDALSPDEKAQPARHYLREWPAMFALAASLLLVVSIGLRWQSESFQTDQQQVALASNTRASQRINESAATLEKSVTLSSPTVMASAESPHIEKQKQAERASTDSESTENSRRNEEKAAQITLNDESRLKKITKSERITGQASTEKEARLASKPENKQLDTTSLSRARDELISSIEPKVQAPAAVAPPPRAVAAPSAIVSEDGRSLSDSVAPNLATNSALKAAANSQLGANAPAEPNEVTNLRKSAQNTPEIGKQSSTDALAQEKRKFKEELEPTPLAAAAPVRASKDNALAPKERLLQIETLIKQSRVEEALLAWQDFRRLFPSYPVPAALKTDLERIEASKILESSKLKTESDKK